MRKSIDAMRKSGALLALFAFISVIFVVGTFSLTRESIKINDKQLLLKTINEIISPSRYDNDLAKSKITLTAKDSGLENNAAVYFASYKGESVGVLFEITTLRGYGVITLLIGINSKDQTLAGVRVVRHTETPGLGDKIEVKKSDWILSFDGKSLINPQSSAWAVKKDGGYFDQFTGATITPRAIVNTVKSTLLYTQDNLDKLLEKQIKVDAKNTEGTKDDR